MCVCVCGNGKLFFSKREGPMLSDSDTEFFKTEILCNSIFGKSANENCCT